MLKLKLRSFRRFIETDNVSFPPGLTVVSGPNGAGKSTVVEAIGYALFGPKRGHSQDVRSDNSLEETCVECELLIDGQAVRIRRYSDRADVYINDVLQVQGIPSSLKSANDQIRVLLGGLTPEQFEATYVALQGDTAGLVADKHDKRREIIEGVLQLDVLKRAVGIQTTSRDTAFEKVKNDGANVCDELQLDAEGRTPLQLFSDARKMERRIQHAQRFQTAVDQGLARRKEESEAAHGSVAETTAEIQRLEDDRGTLLAELEIKVAAVSELEELQRQYHGYDVRLAEQEGQLKAIERQISDLEQRIAKAESYSSAAEEHQHIVEELNQREARLATIPAIRRSYAALVRAESAVVKLDTRLADLSDVDERLVAAQKRADEAHQKVEELQTDPTASNFEAWNVEKGRLEQEENDVRAALATLSHHPDDAKCPTCGQTLQAHNMQQRLEHLTRWIQDDLPARTSAMETEKARLSTAKSKWQTEQRLAREAHDEAQKLLTTLKSKVIQRDELLRDREEALRTLAQAQAEWEELGESGPYDAREENRLSTQLEELRSREKTLSGQAKLYADLPQLRSSRDEKKSELSGCKAQLDALRAEQAAVGYDPVAHEQAKSDEMTTRASIMELSGKLISQEKALGERKVAAQNAKQSLQRAERYQKQFNDSLANFLREERLQGLLTAFQQHFFRANTVKVAQRASRLLLLAVTDQSILGIEFDEADLFYLDASHARKPIARLSGGEKALVGLCLRIALAEQAQALTPVGKLRLLILDEVLSSLDDERRDAVQRILEDVQGRGVFERVILITHLDTVKQSWRASNLEVRKVDGKISQLLPMGMATTDTEAAEKLEV